MKKAIVFLVVLLSVTLLMAAETDYLEAGNYSGQPSNVSVVTLGDKSTTDSVYVDSSVIYGPYNVCVGVRRPSAKGFQAYMPVGGMASGDSVQFAYQMLPGGAISDTGSTWTVTDTLIAGKAGTYTDISSKAGASIAFRLLNIDGTKTGLIAYKKCRVVLITSASETKD